MKSTRLKLWAICDAKAERFDLGLANPTSEDMRESAIGRVLIYTMYWGSWRNTRVRVVAGGTPESMHMRDATATLIEEYLRKNPNDEHGKQALSENPKKKPSKLPEILLTYNNGVYEMMGEAL